MKLQEQRSSYSEFEKLREQIPLKAFSPAPQKLLIIIGHLIIIVASYICIRHSFHFIFDMLLSVIIGHSFACLAFLAHELSHNAIINNRYLRYPLETFLWSLNLIPATIWLRVHNHKHHDYWKAINYFQAERDECHLQMPIFGPMNGRFDSWADLHNIGGVWALVKEIKNLLLYVVRNLIDVCFPTSGLSSSLWHRIVYSRVDRLFIAIEIISIALIQLGIYKVVGGQLRSFVWASPVSLTFAFVFAMAYVLTNHQTQNDAEINHPITACTSVIVPTFFDTVHLNFSYHTEHHIFPSMNSDYYPLVSELLRERYPNLYERLPVTKAWRQIMHNKIGSRIDGHSASHLSEKRISLGTCAPLKRD